MLLLVEYIPVLKIDIKKNESWIWTLCKRTLIIADSREELHCHKQDLHSIYISNTKRHKFYSPSGVANKRGLTLSYAGLTLKLYQQYL